MVANPSIVMEGLAETMAALRAAGAASEDMSKATKAAADVVASASRSTVPVRSGKLRSTISSEGKARFGLVVADKPYAGVVHYGWATRGLGRTIGDVRGKKNTAAAVGLSARTGLTQATLRKASRLNTARNGKGKVRGGPIRPQPWIYEAWDQRQGEVLDRFEAQLDGIEKAFG